MITIYEDRPGKGVRPIGEGYGPDDAAELCRLLAVKWTTTKAGRTAKFDGMTAALAYSDGKPFAVLFGEPCPVPHAEPDAQPRRAK
jgi:hypothetical protein